MSYENLKLTKRDGVLWVTINRPAKLNALSETTLAELDRAVSEAGADDSVLAVVLTGAGDKAFVAGADIKELAAKGPAALKESALAGQATLARIERLAKPVIAAVNGYALGGGCELAMACHIRIASSNAVFGQPEVKLGLIPGFGGTQRLPRLVGPGRALELLISGRNLPAGQALAMGLVNKVVEPEELTQAVDELLKSILGNGPRAVGRCIEAVNFGMDMPFDDACLFEATLFGLCGDTETDEMREGTSAFLEKRKPAFGRSQ